MPIVKLFERGVPNQPLLGTMYRNSRKFTCTSRRFGRPT